MVFVLCNGENFLVKILGIYSFTVFFFNVLYFSNIFIHIVDVITLKSHSWKVIKLLSLLLLLLLLYQSSGKKE